jgi:acyl dehydratase
MIATQERHFEDIDIGDSIPAQQHGPLTIVDTVRWAGLQENWQHLHYDRDHVREHNGLKTFIASGAYRQTLLIRMLTDWIGPRGWLRKISVRHTYSTFEGDIMRFSARIAEKSNDPSDPWFACELEGTNQEAKQILTGRCTLILPSHKQNDSFENV